MTNNDNQQPTAIVRKSYAAGFVDSIDAQLTQSLPKHIDKGFFKQSLAVTIASNPKLQNDECRKSLGIAVMRCAEIGILPNGKQAVLIPYGSKVEYQIGYMGFVEVLDKAGIRVYADNVYSNDSFKRTGGSNPGVHHQIDDTQPRGNYLGTYVCFFDKKTRDFITYEFISAEDMQKIQNKSQNSQAWKEFTDEMRKKSVIKRGAKRLSLTPIVQQAIDDDNEKSGFEKNVTPDVQEPKDPKGLMEAMGLKPASQVEALSEKIAEEDNQDDGWGDALAEEEKK